MLDKLENLVPILIGGRKIWLAADIEECSDDSLCFQFHKPYSLSHRLYFERQHMAGESYQQESVAVLESQL